jgi:hypothetical protein
MGIKIRFTRSDCQGAFSGRKRAGIFFSVDLIIF